MAITALLVFWLLYFLRLYLATVLGSEQLRLDHSFYWILGLGVSFLPALAVLLGTAFQRSDDIYRLLCVFALIGVMVAPIVGVTTVATIVGDSYDIGRLNTSSLNPISMGHLGVTAMLLGISGFWQGRSGSRFDGVTFVVLVLMGALVAMLSSSRGPLVAAAGCIAFLVISGLRRKRVVLFVGLAVLLVSVIGSRNSGLFSDDNGAVGRFSVLLDGGDASSSQRIIAYRGAIEQFSSSPVFGNAIEEKVTGFYPHNLILEGLMATGLLGGIALLFLIFWGTLRSWELLRRGDRQIWLGLLFLQYLIGGMFSGSIYGSGPFWVLLALVLSKPVIWWRESLQVSGSGLISSSRTTLGTSEEHARFGLIR